VGKPYLISDFTENIHISLAHKGKEAVGIARYGKSVGIDMELMEERSEGFYDLVFTDHELALLKGKDQAEWTTRFWVAKEAYGKFLGTGLKGNPKAFEVEQIKDDHCGSTILKSKLLNIKIILSDGHCKRNIKNEPRRTFYFIKRFYY
jgi:phosphopantetheinyl transferase